MTQKKKTKRAAKAPGTKKPSEPPIGAPGPPPIDDSATLDPSRPPVVGIGASAGGLDAFKKFLSAMPTDSGAALVLIPHLDPKHESLMVELLARCTAMPVVEATEGMAVAANQVFVLPPNKYMTISHGVLRLTGPVERTGMQTSIDLFLRSLADDQQDRAICIILSGTGAHGTLGLKAVKAADGMAMVQDPATAEYPPMPQSAIATGLADFILPPEKMPAALVQYIGQYYHSAMQIDGDGAETPQSLDEILALLRTQTKFDFRWYRKKMLRRRIERRMSLSHVDQLAGYVAYLREHPEEIKRLMRDLLISVTNFFRDAAAFQALETQGFVALVHAKEADAPVRIWSAGCATGEEPYSLAMLLLEQLQAEHKHCPVQVFASDVDEKALETARHGVYPETIAADVSPERLKRYFSKLDDGSYQVNKLLRESVIFARQNLITDAPFSKLDLIVCRNLLIYLEPEIQQKVVGLLHFALNEDGYLFLGSSETIGRNVDLFEPISKKWRLFRRLGAARGGHFEVPMSGGTGSLAPRQPKVVPNRIRPISFAEIMHRSLLDRYAPPAVLINRKYEILYYFGSTDRYLIVPSGEPTQDLIARARDGLRNNLRSAIHKAVRDNQPVMLDSVQVKTNGGFHTVNVAIRPIQDPKAAEGLLLVTFEEVEQEPTPPRPPQNAAEETVVRQLESELLATREDLQNAIEELESFNEELKASNEEVMSMNEELQSANEELETSKEELQSLNEELNTVNSQLQDKVVDLETSNNDMSNLLNCTEVAIIFLDRQFRIKRFTAPTTKLYNLIPSDIDRPINDITPKFSDATLKDDLKQVLRTLSSQEKQVRTSDGRSWNLRISPYRTLENRIEGVVLTFTDVTSIREADAQARRLAAVLMDSNDAVTVQDFDGKILAWNRGAEAMFGYTEAEALTLNVTQMIPAELQSEARLSWNQLRRGERVNSWESQRVAKGGRLMGVAVTATVLKNDAGHPIAIAKTERNITEQKRIHAHLEYEIQQRTAALRKSQEQLAALLQTAADAIISINLDGIIHSINAAAERMFGYSASEMLGQRFQMLMPPPYRDEYAHYLTHPTNARIRKTLRDGREAMGRRKDGSTFPIELAMSSVNHLELFTGIVRDISRRKELEREVVEIASLEQRRIGQDLHDTVGQELTALNLLAGTLAESLNAIPEPASKLVEQIVVGLKRSQRELRAVMRGLLPVAVDQEGLMAALTDLARRIQAEGKLACKFHCDQPVSVVDNLTATHLYLIVQEAVHNACKHANAQKILIGLEENDLLKLSVQDDGVGIRAEPSDKGRGLGLRIMQNRAAIIGANLNIQPSEPNGTLVTCVMPRRSHESAADSEEDQDPDRR